MVHFLLSTSFVYICKTLFDERSKTETNHRDDRRWEPKIKKKTCNKEFSSAV